MRKLPDFIFQFLVILLTITTIGIIINVLQFKLLSQEFYRIFAGCSVFIISVLCYFILRVIYNRPESFQISILGLPQSGKTVYLTILFDILQRGNIKEINFTPYGEETIRKVHEDLTLLYSGDWLPPTASGHIFYYKANVSIRSPFLTRRYTLEIGDYAGEYFKSPKDFDPTEWFHQSNYFKYVLQSRAVLLAIDAQKLLSKRARDIEQMQNSMVAALHLLTEHRFPKMNHKIKIPVVIMILKSDLIGKEYLRAMNRLHAKDHPLLTKIKRLIDVCEERYENYTIFFVSSVGGLAEDGSPPPNIQPVNVIKPISWILTNK